MPSMPEIYDSYAYEYDELVAHEDFQNNIPRKLFEIVSFNGKTIIEPGIGTGRVTKLYIEKAKIIYGLDQSTHMIERAKKNLESFSNKISFHQIDNLNIGKIKIKADIIIEGWSFGHTITDNKNSIKETIKTLINQCEQVLNKNGKIIILETMGTGVEKPQAPDQILAEFYSLIEKDFDFIREIISTDYKFGSVEEASRVCGFFFGKNIFEYIIEKNLKIIPEFTGIWYR